MNMNEVEKDILAPIKHCWPQFQISKEDLLRPTQQLVIRFYSNFISDANEKISYLTGSVPDDINKVDLTPEEALFQEVSRLLKKICSLKFVLGDIYQPNPIRTKNFFKICIHFIAFLDQSLNEVDILGIDLFKTKEEVSKLLIEQEELLSEINENVQVKSKLNEFNKDLLERESKSTEKAYKTMTDMKTAKEKLYAGKRNQIETLKREVENREDELNRLEMIKKALLNKQVMESEYNGILHTLETLKTESEMLDNNDVNIQDVLTNENEVLKHCADCIRELNKYVFDLQDLRKLISQEEDLKALSNTLEKLQINKRDPLNHQKLESEKNLLNATEHVSELQVECKRVKEEYVNVLEQFSQEIRKAKMITAEKSQNNQQLISNDKKDIQKLEEDMEKLKKVFAHEYFKVSEAEKKGVDKFKETLTKFGNLL